MNTLRKQSATPPLTTVPYGFCECNCGQKTALAEKTSVKQGWIKGQPKRRVKGHSNAAYRPDLSGAAPFKIDGVYCRLIPLGNNLYAIVDADDYAWLSQQRWCALRKHNTFYPVHTESGGKVVYMHSLINRAPQGFETDHASGIGLDNRRKNLRDANHSQNVWNSRKTRTNKSGYRGVSWDATNRRFLAQITFNGKHRYITESISAEDAARAYDRVAKEVHGAFASLNFPEEAGA